MKVRASFCVIASAMKKAREILFRSQWHFRGSLRMPASVESGSSLYTVQGGHRAGHLLSVEHIRIQGPGLDEDCRQVIAVTLM